MIDYSVFSYAENRYGKLVNVDEVPRGLACNCFCPNCHVRLLARHGNLKTHGFAHQSKERGANLKICYLVTMYKLAEQIIQLKKRIHVPSYYGFYPEQDIYFKNVKIDNSYKRIDKQPDIIAITNDNIKYLIEFTFSFKVQHKQAIEYKGLNCLEIDLSNQNMESIEDFLLTSNKNKVWIANYNYFSSIEKKCMDANKPIRLVNEKYCKKCILVNNCCAALYKTSNTIIKISESGINYRLCRQDKYITELNNYKQKIHKIKGKENFTESKKYKFNTYSPNSLENKDTTNLINIDKNKSNQNLELDPKERVCYNCQNNLKWANKEGKACCGCYQSARIKRFINPEYAKQCPRFRMIH